jgi:uncharacterized membrane protein SpoIIM required for sporulation
MKEITFLKQNYERWQQFEDMLDSKVSNNPDALADLFVRITDDLSWARTYYPGSNTERYLNDLAARIHQEIYKNKKERRSRIITFWTHELPALMGKHRLNLLICVLIFLLSTWVGWISAQHDESFVRIILGDSYVDMTLENISNGDPLGVYKMDNQFVMFLYIALNNSKVALLCILAGLLGWVGVAFMQFRNGVMMGAFMSLLAQHGALEEFSLTVWIHGTIEIWCIIVAGAAGLAFGNGLWFPGAWPRGVSFARGTREALKIGLGLIPFFFLAAFFEGFVTRYTEMNDWGRIAIIGGSLAFVMFYFVVYPYSVGYDHRDRKPMGRFWLILVFIISFPVSLRFIFGAKRKLQAGEVPAENDLLARQPYLNPMSIFLFFLGLLLTILPTITIIMQKVTDKSAGVFANFIFALLYVLAGLAHWRAITWLYKYEEEDLKIFRRKRNQLPDYERKAADTKA